MLFQVGLRALFGAPAAHHVTLFGEPQTPRSVSDPADGALASQLEEVVRTLQVAQREQGSELAATRAELAAGAPGRDRGRSRDPRSHAEGCGWFALPKCGLAVDQHRCSLQQNAAKEVECVRPFLTFPFATYASIPLIIPVTPHIP